MKLTNFFTAFDTKITFSPVLLSADRHREITALSFFLLTRLSEYLNDAIWNGVRNASGDTTKDLFNGFDTITQNEITAPPKRRNLVPLNT